MVSWWLEGQECCKDHTIHQTSCKRFIGGHKRLPLSEDEREEEEGEGGREGGGNMSHWPLVMMKLEGGVADGGSTWLWNIGCSNRWLSHRSRPFSKKATLPNVLVLHLCQSLGL